MSQHWEIKILYLNEEWNFYRNQTSGNENFKIWLRNVTFCIDYHRKIAIFCRFLLSRNRFISTFTIIKISFNFNRIEAMDLKQNFSTIFYSHISRNGYNFSFNQKQQWLYNDLMERLFIQSKHWIKKLFCSHLLKRKLIFYIPINQTNESMVFCPLVSGLLFSLRKWLKITSYNYKYFFCFDAWVYF